MLASVVNSAGGTERCNLGKCEYGRSQCVVYHFHSKVYLNCYFPQVTQLSPKLFGIAVHILKQDFPIRNIYHYGPMIGIMQFFISNHIKIANMEHTVYLSDVTASLLTTLCGQFCCRTKSPNKVHPATKTVLIASLNQNLNITTVMNFFFFFFGLSLL